MILMIIIMASDIDLLLFIKSIHPLTVMYHMPCSFLSLLSSFPTTIKANYLLCGVCQTWPKHFTCLIIFNPPKHFQEVSTIIIYILQVEKQRYTELGNLLKVTSRKMEPGINQVCLSPELHSKNICGTNIWLKSVYFSHRPCSCFSPVF